MSCAARQGATLLHLLRAGAGNANVEKSRRPGHHQTEGKAVAQVQHRLSGDFQWQPPTRKPLRFAGGVNRSSGRAESGDAQPDRIGARRQVALGNLVHACLCDLGRSGIPENRHQWIEAQEPLWQARLAAEALTAADLQYCLAEAARQVARVLDDATGRWILQGGRNGESEFGVTGIIDGAVQSFRFDRAFEDGGERWVVDFKTGPVGGAAQSLQELIARHRPQLQRYRTLAAALYRQPIRTALYLTALPRFIEV